MNAYTPTRQDMGAMSFQRAAVWLGSLVPALVLVWTAYAFRVPDAMRARLVDLSGAWKLLPQDRPEFARPDWDDSAWQHFEVPGSFWAAGVPGDHAWMRRTFDLPPALQHQTLFLELGNPRSGLAQVFLNGHYVGEFGMFELRRRMDVDTGDGWLVRPEWLVPGTNVVALRLWWAEPYNGLAGNNQRLGLASELGLHFYNARLVEQLLRHGPAFMFVFIMALMAVFMAMEGRRGDWYRYASLAALAAGGLYYITGASGVLLAPWMEFQARFGAFYFGPLLINLSALEFLEHDCLHRTTRLRRVNRAVTAVAVVMGLVLSSHRFVMFAALSVWLGITMTYMAFVLLREVRRGQRPWIPLLASAVLCAMAAAVVDLAGNLDLVDAPRLFVLALSNIPVVATVVVVAEFVSISGLNKRLSQSLTLANQELRTALAAAQESSRIKGEFLANVSHELRTPLNPIINIPEVLREEFSAVPTATCQACQDAFVVETQAQDWDPATACPSCGEQRLTLRTQQQYTGQPDQTLELLGVVHRNGQTLLRVVDQMLDVEALTRGAVDLKPRAVEVLPVVKDCVQAATKHAASQGVELVVTPQGGAAVWVKADPERLAQVLRQLLDNAIRFSGGKGRVTVTVRARDGWGVLRVEDQGIGIHPDHHALIFEGFRQVDGQHTRKVGGAGLGLTIAKGLVELQGGTIGVESVLGSGAAFEVRLPGVDPPAAPGATA